MMAITLPSMEFLLATGIGWVTACGIYLVLRGCSFPVVLGLALLGYAVNLFIVVMGRLWWAAPSVLGLGAALADPLPQALVLAAIVIGFATTGFVIALALRSRHESGTDHVDGQVLRSGARASSSADAAHKPPGRRTWAPDGASCGCSTPPSCRCC